jgi:predicted exporter
MRQAAVTPDMRYQLVLHNNSLEALLEDCEQTEILLAAAREDGMLQGWQSVCQLLPSRDSQLRRQARIPTEAILRDRIEAAIASTPFRQDAFEPFVRQAVATRSLPPLGADDFMSTRLQSWIESHLLEFASDWAALISIASPEPASLRDRIDGWPVSAELVDLQSASRELMRDYRSGALKVIAIAAWLIFVLLLFARGRPKQILWVGLTVSSAMATTIAVTSLVHGGLTVVHLVALLLVLGIGLDYALFLSRAESAVGKQWTLKGVFACAASTTLAFAILANSAIPMLSYLGLTVAAGSASSFLLAYVGSRDWRARFNGSAS